MLKPNFLSVCSDGSTDSAITEEEILYARYAIKGEVFVTFLGLVSVPKADANHITRAISDGVEKILGDSEWKKKLVGIGTDGAAVMTGRVNGVVAQFQKEVPYAVGVHCMAHRLELSFKDAAKNNSCQSKLDSLLLGLYHFYLFSPLNRANLKASFQSLEMKILIPTRVGGTRWVSHVQRALEHFLDGYRAIVQHLQQIQSPDAVGVNKDQQAKAKNYFKHSTSLDIVKYAAFMSDVLHHLGALSCKIQIKTVSIAEIHSSIESTKILLERMKTRPGPRLPKLDGKTSFEGNDLSGNDAAFISSSRKLLDQLLISLDKRFVDGMNEGIIQATSLTSFKFWPEKQNMTEFGDNWVDALVTHFTPALEAAGADSVRIGDEWAVVKSFIYSKPEWQEKLCKLTWPELNRSFSSECPNLLALIDLVLSLPASTAECERGFSHMKRIKSDLRSTLNSDALNDLMLTQLLAPSVRQFTPKQAVEVWLKKGPRQRRPNFTRRSSTQSQPDSLTQNLSDSDFESDSESVYLSHSESD